MKANIILRYALPISSVLAMVSIAGIAKAAINCIAPPALSNSIVYDGKCPGDSGFPKDVSAGGRDVYVKLPTSRTCSQALTISNARNLRITRGKFVYNDSRSAVITVRYSSGFTFIDGLYIDVNKKYADAMRTYNHNGRVVVQNTYVRGISGTLNGTHGDLFHPQGGGPGPLQELTLQNVTGLTGYQGLFTPYRPDSGHGTRKLKIDRVNVGYDPNLSKSSGAGKPLMLLFMGSADNSTDQVPDLGTTLSNTYVDGSYWNFAYYKAVYAQPKPGSSGCATFDAKHKISGQACDGRPSQGDFAPASRVGGSYNRSYFCN